MTKELLDAVTRMCAAHQLKPKDPVSIVSGLAAIGVTASIAGGGLELRSGADLLSVGTALAAYATKNPREFFGSVGDVRYKSDLKGDPQAMQNYIKEFGLRAWEILPANPQSPTAKHVIGATIAHAGMDRASYQKLSLAEKSALCAQVGSSGIEAILRRK